jgi:hypothetical protein
MNGIVYLRLQQRKGEREKGRKGEKEKRVDCFFHKPYQNIRKNNKIVLLCSKINHHPLTSITL